MCLILEHFILGPSLAHTVGMRTPALLIALLALPLQAAPAQGPIDPPDEASVLFITGQPPRRNQDENVNTRYVVERAEIRGIRERELTAALRDDLRALEGERLDSAEAEEIEARIRRTLRRYDISRRIVRGSQPGRIGLIYEARRTDRWHWLRFEPVRADVLYHSDQGWGSYLELPIGSRHFRFTPILALDDGDTLIEEYTGVGLRFETRTLGTRRLGASIEWTRFDQTWRDATLDALNADPDLARLYERRSTIAPLLKFAVTPEITVAAGVSISELDAPEPAEGSEMANAAVASIGYTGQWRDVSRGTHRVHASFGVRAGSSALESDLTYRRYLARGAYRYDWGKHRLMVTAMGGGITGDAPLLERFALGDSRTLRGWDKYDIAPAGGDRMLHGSVEYGFRGPAVFLDVGSVWDEGGERRIRVSTGIGLHAGPAFVSVGFPLNTDNLRAVFTIGLRVRGVGIQR